MSGSAIFYLWAANNHFLILLLNDIFASMKKIPIPTLFMMLAVPFVLVTGILMTKSRAPVGVPACYKEVVCDAAQIFDATKIKQLQDAHKTLLDQYDIDLRILIGNLSAAETINYFKATKIGEHSKTRNGALLMVDPQSALVRFHASPTLHEIYSDDFISYIEGQQMQPFFKAAKVSQGIVTTAGMVVTRTQDAMAGKPFVAADYAAVVNRLIGDQKQTPAVPDIQRPMEIVSDYERMMVMGDTSYDAVIYSKASKNFRFNSPITDAQLKGQIKIRHDCSLYKEVILHTGLAAVLYNVNQRQCSPYFLVMENGAWRIDLPTMAKHIRVNNRNEWSMDLSKPFIYADAFLDWTFDKSGIPHPLPPMRWGLLIESDYDARVTYIKKIYDNSPASQMPLNERDVILKWGDISNPTREDVEKSMETAVEGQKINLLLWRNGQRFAVDIAAPPPLK